MTPNPDKPKIDFNVSEEDLAKHKKQMEEERKAEEPVPETEKDKEIKDPAPVFAIGGGSDSEDD